MTELDGVQVRMDAYIDEAWLFRPDEMLKDPAVKRDALGRVISIPRFPSDSHWFKRDDRGAESRPGVVTLTPEMMPLHSHESISVALTHGHQINHNHNYFGIEMLQNPHSHSVSKQVDRLTKSLYTELDIPPSFIPKTIYKQAKLDRDDVMDVGFNVETWLKDEMRKQLIEFEKQAIDTILNGDGSPIGINNKEINMTDRTLRKPESTTVETSDLVTAIRALGMHDLEYLLDAVALVQDLKPGERLTKAKKLKPQDVGVHLQIIDGPAGVLTDIRDYDEFSRQNNGFVKTVLGGKMVDIRGDDFVVVTALAN